MRRRWSYSKYSTRRFGGRRYSRQRVGPGSKRSAYLKGTSFLCNVYATPSDHLEVKAKGDFDSRFTILQNMLPADPYTLRLNTGLVSFRGDMWRWARADGKGFFVSESLQYLCNVCSGLGVSSAVVNMRPPMNKWTLTSKMVLGADMTELDKKYYNVNLTSYSGGNNIIQWGQYGQMYDRYFVDYIVFEYVPSCSRMTDGQVTLLWNDNPTDPIPSTMGQFLTNTRCITTQVYNRARLVVRPRRWLWTCPQAGNTGVRSLSVRNQSVTAIPFTDRTVDCGWFAVCARSGKPEYFSAGTIRVSYGIRFSKPSINLEFIRPTTEANADGTTVDGLKPARELIQPAMPAVQRAPPANSLFLSSSNVNARFVQERGLISRAGDDFMDLDVPQIDGNPQVGSLVMGGGGNPQTVDDQFGSNYIGNPMYYYADTCTGTDGDDGGDGGGDGPDVPPIPGPPVNPDDPDDQPAPGPMMVACKVENPGYYVTNSGSQTYPKYQKFDFRRSREASFQDVDFYYSLVDSGNKSMTPCSVIGLMTMSSDGNYSNGVGCVFCIMGPNLSYIKFTGDPADCEVTLPKASFVLAQTNTEELVNVRVGPNTTFVQYPSQFWYAQGVFDSAIFTDSLTSGTRSCNVGHDFMIVFTGSGLHHYGVTYVPSIPSDVYGVYHPMASKVYPVNAVKQPDVDYKTSSYRADASYSDVPIGQSNVQPIKGSQTVNWFNIPNKLKIGVRMAITLCSPRVAFSCQCVASLYAAVGQGTVSTSGDSMSNPPASPYPHFNALFGFDGHIVTWPPTSQVNHYIDNGVGYIGAAYKVGEYGFYMEGFNTFGGNDDPNDRLVVVEAPTHTGESVGSGPYDGNGTSFIINGTITPDVQFTASKLGIVAGLSITLSLNDSVQVQEWSGYPDYYCAQAHGGSWNPGAGYGAAGAVFVVKQANLIYYDATNVPDDAPTQVLEAYLQANPQSVLLSM